MQPPGRQAPILSPPARTVIPLPDRAGPGRAYGIRCGHLEVTSTHSPEASPLERLEDDLYRIEVPLPESPLGSVNAYVLTGDDRALMVDTGFNRTSCREVLEDALDDLAVDRNRLDFFITHLHADHSGLAQHLAGEDSRLFLNAFGAGVLGADHWDRAYDYARSNGFPADQLEALFEHHPGKQYSGDGLPEFQSLEDGDELTLGSYRLRVVNTPGHTLGHQCLHDPDRRWLFSGDHVLVDITPNISVHSRENRYLLVHYLESLDRVAKLDVRRVLPGHRRPFEDLPGRVDELKQHHGLRVVEVQTILEEGALTAYEVASRMNWDIPLGDWEAFPVVQRWFATGEALSHLWYLEHEGNVRVHEEGSRVRFSSG